MGRNELRFDVYGRFVVVLRDDGGEWWTAERVETDGKRRYLPDVVIPTTVDRDEIVDHLEAVYHEWARAEETITQLGE